MGYDNTYALDYISFNLYVKNARQLSVSLESYKLQKMCPNFISPVSDMGVLCWCACICVLPKPGFTLTCVQPSFKSQSSRPSLKE